MQNAAPSPDRQRSVWAVKHGNTRQEAQQITDRRPGFWYCRDGQTNNLFCAFVNRRLSDLHVGIYIRVVHACKGLSQMGPCRVDQPHCLLLDLEPTARQEVNMRKSDKEGHKLIMSRSS